MKWIIFFAISFLLSTVTKGQSSENTTPNIYVYESEPVYTNDATNEFEQFYKSRKEISKALKI